MTPEEAKVILSVYREGSEDADDPFFEEALALAARDEALARWFASERRLDAEIAARLAEGPVPPGLKDALLSTLEPPNTFEWTWVKVAGLAAIAAIVTFFLTLDLMPGRGGEDSVENYRAEMVNFVNLDPPLDMETADMTKVRDHLAENKITGLAIPGGVAKLPLLGCRSLLFRGYKVGLVCFRYANGHGGPAHLLVVSREAFGGAPLPTQPDFHQEGDWMTATWAQGDMLYVLAAKASREDIEPLLAAINLFFGVQGLV